jgi:hypothetical protein
MTFVVSITPTRVWPALRAKWLGAGCTDWCITVVRLRHEPFQETRCLHRSKTSTVEKVARQAKAKIGSPYTCSFFLDRGVSHCDTHERLRSGPLSLGGTGDLRKTEKQQISLCEAAVRWRKHSRGTAFSSATHVCCKLYATDVHTHRVRYNDERGGLAMVSNPR